MNIAARQDVGVGNVDTLSNAVHGTLFDGQSQQQQQQSNADLTRQLAQLVRTLQRAVDQGGSGKASKSSVGSSSWNSQKGPERGVRYRSGAPPPPPAWKYAKDDLRSFPKWQRKLEIWKRQITSFMSRKDAALLLYSSLTGEAEEELEHCDLDKLASSEGIEYIEQTLKSGLATRLVYQKRKLMSDYESIVRQPSESVRAFANRYRRAEQALQSVSVDIRGMYDDESRGNRLLERSRLSPENQRLVLIGSAYNLAYEAIVESLCMSFPEHKSPPQLFGKDGQPIKARQSFTSPSTSSTTSTSSSSSSFKGKGKGKGFGKAKHAFVTEVEDDQLEAIEEEDDPHESEAEHEAEQEDDQYDQQELADEEAPEESFADIAEVLTVTAKKLQSLTLGRKFSGSKSIEERKKTSTCAACGQVGHWSGDSQCPKSSKGKSDGKGKSKDGSKSTPKKVYMSLHHPDGSTTSHHQEDAPVPNFFTFVTLMVHEVCVAGAPLHGKMVIDTACQRTCAGLNWLDGYKALLHQHQLRCKTVPSSEAFQFGSGAPTQAKDRVYMPVSFGDHLMVIGASAIATNIPLLASNVFLETTQAVIDIASSSIYFGVIDVLLPLCKLNGHLTVDIACFPPDVHRNPVWQVLSDERFWHDPHPEIVSEEPALRQLTRPKKASTVLAVADVATSSSEMVEGMAPGHPDLAEFGVALTPMDVQDGQAASRQVHTSLDDVAGDRGTAGGRQDPSPDEARASQDADRMLAPRMEEARQQVRQLRHLHSLSHPSQVEPGRAGMGSFCWLVGLAKIFLAAALLFKYIACGFIQGQGHQGYGSHSEQVQAESQGQASGHQGDAASSTPISAYGDLFSPSFEATFEQLGGVRSSSISGGSSRDLLGRGGVHGRQSSEQPGRGVELGGAPTAHPDSGTHPVGQSGSRLGKARTWRSVRLHFWST